VMPVSRFIGSARHMQAANISPFQGGVRFTVYWAGIQPGEEGSFAFLNVWTDITVFDPTDSMLQLVVNDTVTANMAQAGPG